MPTFTAFEKAMKMDTTSAGSNPFRAPTGQFSSAGNSTEGIKAADISDSDLMSAIRVHQQLGTDKHPVARVLQAELAKRRAKRRPFSALGR